MISSLKRQIKTVLDPFFWRSSRREFLDLLARHPKGNADDVLAIARAYKGQGWHKRVYPLQVESEYRGLIDWAAAQKPAVVLEIGTAWGGTLLAWARVARELVISVDLEGGIHGGGYPVQKKKLFNLYVSDRPGVSISMIRDDSQKPSTRAQAEKILAGRKLDILFIDGDHRLEGVKADFKLWTPLVRPGGFVVFHDVVKHPHHDCHVDVVWEELKPQYRHWEIVEDPNQGRCGIGIIQLP